MLQAPAQCGDAVAGEAAVGLDLALPRAPRADSAAEALEVAPEAAHPREVVLQLGQLDLQLALGAGGVGGEDVKDHGRTIDDRQSQLGLEVALLAWGELVVAGDHVGVALLRGLLGLGHLARPEIRVGVGLLAALHQLPHHRHAGGAQQLAQLAHAAVIRVGKRCDAKGSLSRAGGAIPAGPDPFSELELGVTALRPLRLRSIHHRSTTTRSRSAPSARRPPRGARRASSARS